MSITVAATLITLLVAGAAWLSLRGVTGSIDRGVGGPGPRLASPDRRRPESHHRRVGVARTIEPLDGVGADAVTPHRLLPRGSGSSDTVSMMIYQFYLPHHDFRVVSDPLDPSPTWFVFAPDDNDELSDVGAALGVARSAEHERAAGSAR